MKVKNHYTKSFQFWKEYYFRGNITLRGKKKLQICKKKGTSLEVLHSIQCIHTAVMQGTMEELTEKMEDPEAFQNDVSNTLVEHAQNGGWNIIDLDGIDQKIFALESWIQGICEMGLEGIIIQHHIENAETVIPLASTILKYIMNGNTEIIELFIENVIKECRFEGQWHIPSLLSNVRILLSSLYIDPIREDFLITMFEVLFDFNFPSEIWNDKDVQRHIEYLTYVPTKHSTFRRFMFENTHFPCAFSGLFDTTNTDKEIAYFYDHACKKTIKRMNYFFIISWIVFSIISFFFTFPNDIDKYYVIGFESGWIGLVRIVTYYFMKWRRKTLFISKWSDISIDFYSFSWVLWLRFVILDDRMKMGRIGFLGSLPLDACLVHKNTKIPVKLYRVKRGKFHSHFTYVLFLNSYEAENATYSPKTFFSFADPVTTENFNEYMAYVFKKESDYTIDNVTIECDYRDMDIIDVKLCDMRMKK